MADNPIVTVSHLEKAYPVRTALFSKEKRILKAVDGVSLSIRTGETLALVGESGSGKTTLGRCLLRLIEPTGGTILFQGTDITPLSEGELRPFRRKMQIIFQDPYGSLNPRQTVDAMLREILEFHKLTAGPATTERIEELLGLVGLPASARTKYPHEFSGGQRQRINIARALSVEPSLIICDEPVSALDVSIQAQIINLLMDLQDKLGLSYLFISHDLAIVRHVADRIAVMYLGEIVEEASADELFRSPKHPYTKMLLDSMPVPNPDFKRENPVIKGEIPSPINKPSGCPFHPRCPVAIDVCETAKPESKPAGDGFATCHLIEH